MTTASRFTNHTWNKNVSSVTRSIPSNAFSKPGITIKKRAEPLKRTIKLETGSQRYGVSQTFGRTRYAPTNVVRRA